MLDAFFSLEFLDKHEHVLLVGPAGVGKSFLAQALGYSADLYELILNRHRTSSFVITSDRAVDEWLSLFDDPILGNSALDRLANASYQIVIEGASYRDRLSPHRALSGVQGGD